VCIKNQKYTILQQLKSGKLNKKELKNHIKNFLRKIILFVGKELLLKIW